METLPPTPLSAPGLLARPVHRVLVLASVAAVSLVSLRLVPFDELHKYVPSAFHIWLEDQLSTASAYYQEQRPVFAAAARGYPLYWPFAQTAGIDSLDLSFYRTVQLRLQAWARLMRHFGRDDYKIEKDKCQMYEFLALNSFPHPPILQRWSSNETLVADIISGAAFSKVQEWPVFLKACHLTQFDSNGVFRVKSLNWATEHMANITDWVTAKMAFRSDDRARIWREDGNILTDTITPGFALQLPGKLSYDADAKEWTMFELKVDVYWGRAYAAVLTTPTPKRSVFMRSKDATGAEYHRTVGLWSLGFIHRYHPDWLHPAYSRWVLSEGHFRCVWPLAERVARTVGIDELRVDIFITAGSPDDCVVNEISLSSGLTVPGYSRYAAKIWAEPHIERWYRPVGNSSSKPAYKRTAADAGDLLLRQDIPAKVQSNWGILWGSVSAAATGLLGAVAWCLWPAGRRHVA